MADTSITFTPKSFLQRPEGKLGIVFPILAISLVVWFFGSPIGDFIVNAGDNMLHFILVALTLAIILSTTLFVMFDSKIRATAFYLYRSVMRWLTGMFIEIDPIGILRTYKERLEGKLTEMDGSIALLNSQRLKVERIINRNNSDIENSMRLVQAAVARKDERVKALEGKQVVRLTDENKRVGGDYNRIRFLIEVLNRYRTLSQDTITDMGREIDSKQREREYSRASQNAIRSAMGILKGLPDEKQMYEQSLEVLEDQYSRAIGEVEHFLDITKDIISTSDLQNAADGDKAMSLLNEWQAKNGGMMVGGQNGMSKADIISSAQAMIAAPNTGIHVNTGKPNYQAVPVQSSGDDDYLKMMANK
jgi:hypothetical protein